MSSPGCRRIPGYMPTSAQVPTRSARTEPTETTGPTAAFVASLAARNFAEMAEVFAPGVAMRALLPRGPAEFNGVEEVVDAFKFWFGSAAGYEVVATSVDDVGGRLHASWRFRVDATPRGVQGWHVIEQQAYLQVSDRIDSVDLLCTGFIPDGGTNS